MRLRLWCENGKQLSSENGKTARMMVSQVMVPLYCSIGREVVGTLRRPRFRIGSTRDICYGKKRLLDAAKSGEMRNPASLYFWDSPSRTTPCEVGSFCETYRYSISATDFLCGSEPILGGAIGPSPSSYLGAPSSDSSPCVLARKSVLFSELALLLAAPESRLLLSSHVSRVVFSYTLSHLRL